MPAHPVNTATRSPKPIIECQQCGTAHEQRRIGSIYCSKACATKASSIRRANVPDRWVQAFKLAHNLPAYHA